MSEIFNELTPLSKGGILLLILGGLILFLTKFNFWEGFWGKLGESTRGKKSHTILVLSFRTGIGCISFGIILFVLGFYTNPPSSPSHAINWKIWESKWDVEFYGDIEECGFQQIGELRFGSYIKEGKNLYGILKDEYGEELGRLYKIESMSSDKSDFQSTKGIYDPKLEGKNLVAKFSLLPDKETFIGVISMSTSTQKVICFGQKR